MVQLTASPAEKQFFLRFKNRNHFLQNVDQDKLEREWEKKNSSVVSSSAQRESNTTEPKRCIDMSEAEKQEVYRQRNIANLRKSRNKMGNEENEDKRTLEENDKKIVDLERMVKNMERELGKNYFISRVMVIFVNFL